MDRTRVMTETADLLATFLVLLMTRPRDVCTRADGRQLSPLFVGQERHERRQGSC